MVHRSWRQLLTRDRTPYQAMSSCEPFRPSVISVNCWNIPLKFHATTKINLETDPPHLQYLPQPFPKMFYLYDNSFRCFIRFIAYRHQRHPVTFPSLFFARISTHNFDLRSGSGSDFSLAVGVGDTDGSTRNHHDRRGDPSFSRVLRGY